MSFNFALFIKHPDPEYLTFNPDFVNEEVGNTGYNTAYMDTIGELTTELATRISASETDGTFTLHTEDPTVCVVERRWSSIEAATSWITTVASVHQSTGAPLPLEAKVVDLATQEETIIYPA